MPAQSFPKLKTKQWILRNFSLNDLQLVEKASKDPLIPLITSIPQHYSEEEGNAFIKRQWSRYENKTGYSFAIAQTENNPAIGSLYLGLDNINEGRASLGYWLIQSARGQGIMKIILQKAVEWAQQDLKIPRLELYAEPWNIASIKTAESCGFTQEGILRSWQLIGDERKDMLIMSLIDNP